MSLGQAIIQMMATFVIWIGIAAGSCCWSDLWHHINQIFQRITARSKYPDLENPVSKDYHVRFYDLNMNGHVNNSKYLDWIFEVMGADFLTKHIPKKVHLKYVKEVRPGSMI